MGSISLLSRKHDPWASGIFYMPTVRQLMFLEITMKGSWRSKDNKLMSKCRQKDASVF